MYRGRGDPTTCSAPVPRRRSCGGFWPEGAEHEVDALVDEAVELARAVAGRVEQDAQPLCRAEGREGVVRRGGVPARNSSSSASEEVAERVGDAARGEVRREAREVVRRRQRVEPRDRDGRRLEETARPRATISASPLEDAQSDDAQFDGPVVAAVHGGVDARAREEVEVAALPKVESSAGGGVAHGVGLPEEPKVDAQREERHRRGARGRQRVRRVVRSTPPERVDDARREQRRRRGTGFSVRRADEARKRRRRREDAQVRQRRRRPRGEAPLVREPVPPRPRERLSMDDAVSTAIRVVGGHTTIEDAGGRGRGRVAQVPIGRTERGDVAQPQARAQRVADRKPRLGREPERLRWGRTTIGVVVVHDVIVSSGRRVRLAHLLL
mmetsp:Transcript_12099/g.48708  ORF Transcript_12099/g.48708 Transcript_12099/m.48708 type:complete len:384 (-) Transcript_12099:93-1244(-)